MNTQFLTPIEENEYLVPDPNRKITNITNELSDTHK
jgi:hypothetical protein